MNDIYITEHQLYIKTQTLTNLSTKNLHNKELKSQT